MALIQTEQDDAAILAVEDAAIEEARKPQPADAVEDIATLIERLTNGDQTAEG